MRPTAEYDFVGQLADMQDLRIVRERFAMTSALLADAHAAVWRDVGKVYEIAARFETDANQKRALIDRLNEMLPEWGAEDKSIFENLLVFAVGEDNLKDSRQPYLAVLNEAAASGVPRLEEEFADWLASRHGPVLAGSNRDPLVMHPLQIIADFAMNPDFMVRDKVHLDYDPPGTEGSLGFGVALLKVDRGGGSNIVGIINDPDDVCHVMEALTAKRSRAAKARRRD